MGILNKVSIKLPAARAAERAARETARQEAAAEQQRAMAAEYRRQGEVDYANRIAAEQRRAEEWQRQQEREQRAHLQMQERLQNADLERKRLERLKKAEPATLRHLRQLIRTRYRMDLYIWSLRNTIKINHHVVEDEGRKADAVLREIFDIIESWDEDGGGFTETEWRIARRIKDQMASSQQRWWQDNPPWDDSVSTRVPHRQY